MKRARSLSWLPILLLSVSCGDAGTSPEDSPVGAWTLEWVDDSPLPFTLDDTPDYRLELTAGQLFLEASGSCSHDYSLRMTLLGVVTDRTESISCTWMAATGLVELVGLDGAPSFSGSWTDDFLAIDFGGLVYSYSR